MLISIFAFSKNTFSPDEINKIEKAISKRIDKAKLQQQQLGEIVKNTKKKLEQVDVQIVEYLQKYFTVESQGVLPVLLGVESIDDFIFRSYMMKQISKKNQALFSQYNDILTNYEEKKQEAESIKIELIKYQKDFNNLLSANQNNFDLSFYQDELNRLSDRQDKLSELINGLPSSGDSNESLPSIIKFKGYLEPPQSGSYAKSVFEGKVVYVGFMNGFGNTIIIDHGSSVHSVYANFATAEIVYGEYVKRGQTIASMGNVNNTPEEPLYFEIRLNGVEQNIKQWISLKPVK
ncbi:MAG: peptidoglycan DD-metalloendopeptidase family protein [bacterium]|nr:peptidoglycan DD-metalloendopeptidase family protein [bacterium]